MADLQVVAVLKAKEGKEAVIAEAMKSVVAPSRQDKGCIRYDLFEVQDSPGTLVNIETWASEADLNEHMKSPHLGAAFASASDALDGAPQIYMLSPLDVA